MSEAARSAGKCDAADALHHVCQLRRVGIVVSAPLPVGDLHRPLNGAACSARWVRLPNG